MGTLLVFAPHPDDAEIFCGGVILKYLAMGWEDTQVEVNLVNRNRIIEAIRRVRPNLVLAPDPNDYHSDHRALGELVVNAVYLTGVPLLRTESEACPPPRVYFYETHGGIGFQPERWVDISAFFAKKTEMLKCHQSQIEWLMEHDGFDLLDYTGTKDRWHGFQCGSQYAEVFRPHRVFPVAAEDL